MIRTVFFLTVITIAFIVLAQDQQGKPMKGEPSVYEVKEDVVVDKNTRLLWQRGHSDKRSISYFTAEKYCSDLKLGEYDDWRLPKISELRTIIKGCKKTQPGGTCEIGDKSAVENWNEDCGCKYGDGPGEKGYYWEKSIWKTKNSDYTTLWSSSTVTDDKELAWFVFMGEGAVGYFFKKGHLHGMMRGAHTVRCVRTNK